MKTYRLTKIYSLVLVSMILSCGKETEQVKEISSTPQKPNIIVIYADDLGYGDVSSYGSKKLITKNFDRIANEGIRFTNGYATSPTCTPSRYSLLSGSYPFRNKEAAVLPGNAPLLFELGKQTLPSMLRDAGYKTGVIGKWHLGLGGNGLDWNQEIKPGPLEIGFDYCYVMASTNDRVPSVYVKNHRIVGLNPEDPIYVSYKENFEGEPTGKEHPELLKVHPSHGHNMSIHNGISRIGYMKGGKSALFTDENMNDDFLNEVLAYITENKDGPFFLFYSLHQPHVPRIPHPRFEGVSGLGPRGDAIMEADWSVGQVLDKLKELGIDENTMVVFSSDNGPVLDDGYKDMAVELNGDHDPNGGLRGGKYSLFEAGTHVPFMIRWPGTIEPGVSDALVCQVDFTASFAALTGQKNNTPDSQNILEAFLGKSSQGRKGLLLGKKNIRAYRKGDYVLIPPHKGSKMISWGVNIESGRDSVMQLYHVKDDWSQMNNLATNHPDLVEEMYHELDSIRNSNSD